MRRLLPALALALAIPAIAQLPDPSELLAQARAQAKSEPAPQPFLEVLRQNGIDPKLAAGLKEHRINVYVLPADTDIYQNHAQTWPRHEPDGSCKLVVIHPSMSRAAMTHQLATIPAKYARDFSGPDYTFLRVLLHEATHCGMAEVEDGLTYEIEGELFAIRALLELPGGAQEARIQKHRRAIRAMLGEGVTHALAPSLDALERGAPLPAPAAVEASHLALYQMLYAEEILFPDVHGYVYEKEGELICAVYAFMKRGLISGRFENDPLMKREAELYVEAVDELAPAMLAAHP